MPKQGVKYNRIAYTLQVFTRTCQPIPFSAVHFFVSSYTKEHKHAEEINEMYPPNRKFLRDIKLKHISGTLFEKTKRHLVKKQSEFWTVRETIDGKHKTSVQYPDSKTQLGYEAV